MPATLSTLPRSAAAEKPGALSRALRACQDGIAAYFARREAIAILRELDDYALRDIGIKRYQIEAAVHGTIPAPNRMRM
jgi:uncharacterized protein YjiS (DUF1127 family)